MCPQGACTRGCKVTLVAFVCCTICSAAIPAKNWNSSCSSAAILFPVRQIHEDNLRWQQTAVAQYVQRRRLHKRIQLQSHISCICLPHNLFSGENSSHILIGFCFCISCAAIYKPVTKSCKSVDDVFSTELELACLMTNNQDASLWAGKGFFAAEHIVGQSSLLST